MYYCVLAGGKSRRMGQDKAFLSFGEKFLIEDMVERFYSMSENVCISSAVGDVAQKMIHAKKKPIEVADLYTGIGPLGGIYSLLHCVKDDIFVVAVDMPLVDVRLVQCMLELAGGKAAVLQRSDGRLEPLFAYYTKECGAAAWSQIQSGNYRMTDFIEKADITCISENELEKLYGKGFEKAVFNMNTPSDYEKVLDFIARI